jgi:nanoRNase/pAp phosphatase (c-di-AMP/oligoRNAs hydrolase)
LKKIADALCKSQKIALICHINPDGDTVGSALALYRVLTKIGKNADVFCADEIGEKLKYLPFSDRFNVNREQKYDLAAAIDCGDRGRMGLMSEIFDGAKTTVCIDHHKTNSLKCDYIYVDCAKASTAEIIYSLIKTLPNENCNDGKSGLIDEDNLAFYNAERDKNSAKNAPSGKDDLGFCNNENYNDGKSGLIDEDNLAFYNAEKDKNSAENTLIDKDDLGFCKAERDKNSAENTLIDKDAATLIYAGILTDTGMFSYPSTSAETHKIAADLYGYGIDASDIAYNVFKKKSMPAFLLAHKALGKTRFFKDGKIGIVTFFLKDFEETGAVLCDTEGLVNSIQTIDGVFAAMALTEIDSTHFRVSIRTKTPVDASAIAGEFGGGGHTLAAGCRLQGSYEEIIERLVKAADDYIY